MSGNLDRFRNIKKIGRGAFGQVFLIEDEAKNQFALKVIEKNKIEKDPTFEEYLKGEKECMLNAKNDNIVELV